MKRNLLRICAAACAVMIGLGAFAESGVDMLAVDHKLYELGYRDSACNGVLDEVTITALKNFQRVNGLEPTGEPNSLTVEILMGGQALSKDDYLNIIAQRNAAQTPLADGSSGESVKRMQESLKELGYYSGSCDGVYGDETEAAVYRFQLANGLNESGVADQSVFVRLYGDAPVAWKAFLESSCASAGDSGVHVRRLQIWLKKKGYFAGECTGRFGDGTLQAVKNFQTANDLDASGDADLETCRKIYNDVKSFLRASAQLRRGDTGAEAEQLCRDLATLGYPAHARFNMQTELALMQFQLVNKLDVTGVADDVTLVRLRSENATHRSAYEPSRRLMPENDAIGQKMARQANALLGQYSELDTCFGLVQYVALMCDVELMDPSQLNRLEIGEADSISSGAILGMQIGERQICGIATSDRAIIYRADNGYIIMNYLDRMEAQDIWLYHVAENV